jgi:hypothetical protein
MFRGTSSKLYLLAFNPKAKARPNFGLRNVGYNTSDDVYGKRGHAFSLLMVASLPVIFGYICHTEGLFRLFDEVGGGGPKSIPPAAYGVTPDLPPWEFVFAIGEGYANGPARLRPAPGVDVSALHH